MKSTIAVAWVKVIKISRSFVHDRFMLIRWKFEKLETTVPPPPSDPLTEQCENQAQNIKGIFISRTGIFFLSNIISLSFYGNAIGKIKSPER